MFKWKVVLLWEWYCCHYPILAAALWGRWTRSASSEVGRNQLLCWYLLGRSGDSICMWHIFAYVKVVVNLKQLCFLSGKIHISGREASSWLSFNVISFAHNIKGLISFIHYIKGFQICHRGSPRGKIFESLIWKMSPIYGAIVNNFTFGFGL